MLFSGFGSKSPCLVMLPGLEILFYCRTCFSSGDLGVQVSVSSSVRSSIRQHLPGCLVSATPLTVLYRSVETLHVFSSWYEDVHVVWI